MSSLFSFQTEGAPGEVALAGKTCKVIVTTADGTFRYSGEVLSSSQAGLDVVLNAPDFDTLSEYVTDILILPEGAVSPWEVTSYSRQEGDNAGFDSVTAVGESTTYLQSVIADMHWGNAFEPGLGVDAMTNNLCPSAMKVSLDDAQRPTVVQVNATKISTASEYRQAVDLAVSGHYNTGNIDLKGSFSYMSDIKCSNTSLSIIVEYSVVESVYGTGNTYVMKEEAKEYLGNGQAFRERYGDYFIADVRRGSRFTAVYTCTTESEEKMAAFKGELSASGDLYGFSTSAGFTNAAKKNNVATNIRLYYEGCQGSPVYTSTQDVMDVNKALGWFTNHISYVPLFAKLHHYSMYAPEVSKVLPVAPQVFSRIWNLFDTINIHYCDAQNCPKNYTAEIVRNAMALRKEIIGMQPHLAESPHNIAAYQDKVNDLKAELALIMNRYRIYQTAKAAAAAQSGTGSWCPSDKEGPLWRYGETTPQEEVVEVYLHAAREGSCCYRKRDTLTFNQSDKIILGYIVRAGWSDGTCGRWKRSSGGLLSGILDIDLESWLSRGYSWGVLVYAGKKSDFNFE